MMRTRLLAPLAAAAMLLSACAIGGPAVVSVPEQVGASGLLVRLGEGSDTRGLKQHLADYVADGTVIRWVDGTACDRGQPCGSLQRNALTASGLTAVRALLAEHDDLLAEPMVIESQLAPGARSADRGEITHVFVMERPDGTRYRVEVPSTRSIDAALWVPDARIERLNALAEGMLDPLTIVGTEGLVDPTWTPYQPSALAVVIRHHASAQPPVFDGPFGPDVQQTGWPFGGSPDSFGDAFEPKPNRLYFTADSTYTYRCAFLAHDDAVKAISSLQGSVGASLAEGMLAAGEFWGSGGMRWGDKLDFSMRAITLLPEDVARSCDDAFDY